MRMAMVLGSAASHCSLLPRILLPQPMRNELPNEVEEHKLTYSQPF